MGSKKKSDEPSKESQSSEKKTEPVSPFEAIFGDDLSLLDEDY
jgi:hypothetical protein